MLSKFNKFYTKTTRWLPRKICILNHQYLASICVVKKLKKIFKKLCIHFSIIFRYLHFYLRSVPNSFRSEPSGFTVICIWIRYIRWVVCWQDVEDEFKDLRVKSESILCVCGFVFKECLLCSDLWNMLTTVAALLYNFMVEWIKEPRKYSRTTNIQIRT